MPYCSGVYTCSINEGKLVQDSIYSSAWPHILSHLAVKQQCSPEHQQHYLTQNCQVSSLQFA